MTRSELARFGAHRNLNARLRLRRFDDLAKRTDFKVPGLSTYREPLIDCISEGVAASNDAVA